MLRYDMWTRNRELATSLRNKCKYITGDMEIRRGLLMDKWDGALEDVADRYDLLLDSGKVEYTCLQRLLPGLLQCKDSKERIIFILAYIDVYCSYLHGHFRKAIITKHGVEWSTYESHLEWGDFDQLLIFIDEHSVKRDPKINIKKVVNALLASVEQLWNCDIPEGVCDALVSKQKHARIEHVRDALDDVVKEGVGSTSDGSEETAVEDRDTEEDALQISLGMQEDGSVISIERSEPCYFSKHVISI